MPAHAKHVCLSAVSCQLSAVSLRSLLPNKCSCSSHTMMCGRPACAQHLGPPAQPLSSCTVPCRKGSPPGARLRRGYEPPGPGEKQQVSMNMSRVAVGSYIDMITQ